MKKSFEEIFEDKTKCGTKIKTERYKKCGVHPIIDQGQELVAGYTDCEEGLFEDVPVIIFGDHTRIIKYVDKPFFLGADGVKVLRSKYKDANYRYLYYALKNAKIPDTGYNRHFKWLKNVEIKYLDAEKQSEIVEILDKVSSIINRKRQEVNLLDNLIKSRFVELFGDPKSNPMKWRRMTLKQAGIRLSDGPFGSNLKSDHYTNEGIRVIRLGNIGVGKFIDNDKSFVSYEHYKMIEKYTCRAGEIVIGTLGDPNLRACIVPENIEFAINKADCVHYIPKAELLNNYFVCQYINCPETLLLASAMIHGQTRARISSGQLAELPIYIPPMELQDKFAAFVVQTDKSKLLVQKSLEETQQLFDALMQKYFS